MNLKDKFKKSKIENGEASRATGQKQYNHPKKIGTLKVKDVTQLSELLLRSRAREKAMVALLDALQATKVHFDPEIKKMVVTPDHRIRAIAAVNIFEFTDGKPVERREQVNINIDGNEEAQRKIIESPALRAAIAARIREAEEATAQADIVITESGKQNKGNS